VIYRIRRRALLLSCTQTSVAEFTRQTRAPDETERPDWLVARFRIARTERELARPRRGRSQLVRGGVSDFTTSTLACA